MLSRRILQRKRKSRRKLSAMCTPIFEAKKLRKVEEKCPGHFDSSQFSPKSAIFGGFEKKSFQK